jgi:hypothetical protein
MSEQTYNNVVDPNVSPVAYEQNSEGKWVLTEQAKAWSKRLYYSGRVAYSNDERRSAVGKYNQHGEVIPFKRWQTT